MSKLPGSSRCGNEAPHRGHYVGDGNDAWWCKGIKQETRPYRASCADCGWEGRRRWPSPTKPCPHCAGKRIGRVILGHHGWQRIVPWASDDAGIP